jgi:hypothetical protein
MGYIPTRDRFELSAYTESRIWDLAEKVDTKAVRAYHDDECNCAPGRGDIDKCLTGANGYGTYAAEVLAHLYSLGVLSLDAAENALTEEVC